MFSSRTPPGIEADSLRPAVYVACLLLVLAFNAAAQTCGSAPRGNGPDPRQAPALVLKHDPAVEAVLKVTRISMDRARASSVPIEIEFRNQSKQAITAFEFGFRVQYSEGNDFTGHSGTDFIKAAAQAALRETKPEIFAPGATRKVTRTVPLGPDDTLPVFAEAYPAAVLLADRTALGDGKQIAAILDARRSEAEEMADLIGDLETALASDDPQRALASRIAQLSKGGARSGPYARRAALLKVVLRLDQAAAQSRFEALQAQQETLAEQFRRR